jgi:hypothetical protein
VHRQPLIIPLVWLALAACSRQQNARPEGQGQSAGTVHAQPASQAPATASGTSYGAAAAKLTDMCPLAPTKLVQTLVPNAGAPEKERYPLRCTFGNGKNALGLTIDNGPPDPINGADAVSGLGQAAYLERLDPHARGDVYLTVVLGPDANGTNYNLHVEVAGHDGKDHKDDAIAVARKVLAQLK